MYQLHLQADLLVPLQYRVLRWELSPISTSHPRTSYRIRAVIRINAISVQVTLQYGTVWVVMRTYSVYNCCCCKCPTQLIALCSCCAMWCLSDRPLSYSVLVDTFATTFVAIVSAFGRGRSAGIEHFSVVCYQNLHKAKYFIFIEEALVLIYIIFWNESKIINISK